MKNSEEKGFSPTSEDQFNGALTRFKLDNGVPQPMMSCHTALIEGYVIEGNVPAADVRRLLRSDGSAEIFTSYPAAI